MTENELIQRLQQGDQGAFRTLVDEYRDRVYRISLGIVNTAEDAEDIAQDVFIEVFRAVHAFKGQSRLSTWLYRITVNKSLNHVKKHRRSERVSSLASVFTGKTREPAAGRTDHPDGRLEQNEKARLLESALKSLNESQRLAFTLHKVEEMPHKEIADIMGTSVSSVESLIFRAKANLQKKLSSFYHT